MREIGTPTGEKAFDQAPESKGFGRRFEKPFIQSQEEYRGNPLQGQSGHTRGVREGILDKKQQRALQKKQNRDFKKLRKDGKAILSRLSKEKRAQKRKEKKRQSEEKKTEQQGSSLNFLGMLINVLTFLGIIVGIILTFMD